MTSRHFMRRLFVAVLLLLLCWQAGQAENSPANLPPEEIEARKRLQEAKDKQIAAEDALRERIRAHALCLAGTDTAYTTMESLYEEFLKTHPEALPQMDYTGGGTEVGLREFLARHVDVALLRRDLKEEEKSQLAKAFPDPNKQPQVIPFSRSALVIAVHQGNRVPALSYKQLEDIFRGEISQWVQVRGTGATIARVGTMYPALSAGIFNKEILAYKRVRFPDERRPPSDVPIDPTHHAGETVPASGKSSARPKFPGAGPFPRYKTDREMLAEVAKNSGAIGYCLMPTDGEAPKGVRFVPVVPPGQDTAVAPTRENVLLDKYPLQLAISFLVNPDAPQGAQEFVKFACSDAAAPRVRECGLQPVSEKEQILTEQRLAEAKAGKGVRIQAAGSVRSPLLKDLATEYVRAKAVVQMAYFPTNEAEAVTQFVHGKELLLLNGPVSDRILKVHASTWDAMKPESHMIAGRAVAIVTSIVNKEEAMILDRVRSIFAGEVGQWDENFPMAQKDIHCYGLGAADPMAALFFSGVMRSTRCKNLQAKKDTAGVLAALALDPQGIAFVDLAAIPQDSTAVRIVAIGPADKAVRPDGKTVAEGTYPLSKPLVLYVSPQASETTREFVRFILSGACDAVFRQHGFVPAGPPPPAR